MNRLAKLYCFFLFCNCRISDGSVCTGVAECTAVIRQDFFYECESFVCFLDTTATTIAMVVVDHFMKSVSASLLSILVVAFLFAITSLDEVKRDCDCKDEKERWEEKSHEKC